MILFLKTEQEIRFERFHSGGKGGQNVNKVETGVRLIHIPTGITVTSTSERSQYANKKDALSKLNAILEQREQDARKKQINLAWREHTKKLIELYIFSNLQECLFYTQVIEAFLTNQINVYEVERLFYKGSLGNQIFLRSEKAFQNIRWVDAYEVIPRDGDKNADIYARREVNKFLSARMKAVLIDGYEVPGITARYAIQNRLLYKKEGGDYENAGI